MSVQNSQGNDATIGASGNAGADVTISNGAGNIFDLVAPSPAAVGSNSGDVTVLADKANIGAGSGIRANAGIVTISPPTPSHTIDLGSPTDLAAGALELSAPELDRFTTPTLRIGSATSGAIDVTAPIAPANAPTLSLLTQNGISQQPGATVSAGSLALEAGASILLPSVNDVDTLAARTTQLAANAVFHDVGELGIGDVDTLSGITATGEVVLDVDGGALTIDRMISTPGERIVLLSAGPVNQDAAGRLLANELLLLDGGPFTLTNPMNDVTTLAAHVNRPLELVAAPTPGFEIGTVAGFSGVFTTNDAVTIEGLVDFVDVDAPIVAGSAPVELSLPLEDAPLNVNAPIAAGAATITADRMALCPCGEIDAGISNPSNAVLLRPSTPDQLIDLGSASDASNTTLELSDAELDRVTADNITIGREDAGLTTVTGPIDPLESSDLRLIGSGGFTATGPGALSEDSLTLTDTSPVGRTWTQTAPNLNAGPGAPIGYALVDELTLNGDGNDTFNVQGTPASTSTVINAGPGDDAVNVGSPANSLDQIAGPLDVDGEDGTGDALRVRDQGDADANSYMIDSDGVDRTGAGMLSYSSIELLDVEGSSAGNAFAVEASPQATYSLHGNAPTTAPGDSLAYDSEGREVSGDTTGPSGLISSPGVGNVSYDGMESVTPLITPASPPPPPPHRHLPRHRHLLRHRHRVEATSAVARQRRSSPSAGCRRSAPTATTSSSAQPALTRSTPEPATTSSARAARLTSSTRDQAMTVRSAAPARTNSSATPVGTGCVATRATTSFAAAAEMTAWPAPRVRIKRPPAAAMTRCAAGPATTCSRAAAAMTSYAATPARTGSTANGEPTTCAEEAAGIPASSERQTSRSAATGPRSRRRPRPNRRAGVSGRWRSRQAATAASP